MPIRPYPPCGAPGCSLTAKNYTYHGGPGMCSMHQTRLRRWGTYDIPEDAEVGARVRQPIHTMHDTGCEYSPSCLRCPLPACKDEMSHAELTEWRMKRWRERMAT